MTNLVQFPGLGLSFELDRVAFSIGGMNIYWYGVCIAVGMCLALVFAFRHSVEFGVDADAMVDVILIGVVMGILCARLYYVALSPYQYHSLKDVLAIRDGGLAIYGGLIGALLVGVNFAKGLAFSANKPLVPVHHLRSHIAANYITHPDLEPPFLALVVSGGHSHIIEVRDYTDFHIIGRTRDDAAGEAMDKAARAMGLDYPGGVNLDRVSKNGDPKSYKLPRPHVDGSEYDFSFSGLKTAAVNIIHNAKQKGEEISVPDLGASYIEAVVRCLRENTEKAALNFGFDKIVLAGGVSANSRLRAEMTDICKAHSWSLFMPELSLCGDNAAMVGAQGYYEFKAGNIAPLTLNARASMPIDEIDKFLSKKV